MRLVVNPDRCQGIGLCEAAAADIIEVGEDGQSHMLVDELMPSICLPRRSPSPTALPRRCCSRNRVVHVPTMKMKERPLQ